MAVDSDAVRVGTDLDQMNRSRRQVDDRHLVRLVEGHGEHPLIRGDGQTDGPAQP